MSNYYMSREEQDSIIGRQINDYKAVKAGLLLLVDKAKSLAQGTDSVSRELGREASIEEPVPTLKPGGAPQLKFITKEEYTSLIEELKSERSKLNELEKQLRRYGISMDA